MTRWVILAVLVVALSAAAAVVVPLLPTEPPVSSIPFLNKEKGPPGKIVLVGDPRFEFGLMAQYQTGEHTWVLKNEGEGDLELTANAVCSCTTSDLPLPEQPPRILKPGESYPVKLTWKTKDFKDKWSRELTIYVGNDANRGDIKLTIAGEIQPALLVYPSERSLQFSTIPSDMPAKGRVAVSSPDRPDLKLTSARSSNPDSVTATFAPMTPEDLKSAGIEKGGWKVEIEVKPSSNLGIFSEEITVGTDHVMAPDFKITVSGKRIGPITLIPETVRLSQVSSSNGGELAVMMIVRNAPATKFEVVETPENVEAKIAASDAKTGATAKVRQYRMTVTVPPGTPAGLIVGTITIKTDHPDAKQLKIPVDITVKSD